MLLTVLILGCLSLQDADSITVDPKNFGNSSLEITTTMAPADVAELWQTGPFCGANSLYVLLKLEGRPVDHKAIRAEVPTTQKGANLAQLQEAAGRHGLPCEVASIAPTRLKAAMAPFIALLGLKSDGSIDGHFVVVVGMDDRTIYTIDGTTGNFDKFSRPVFNKAYSGVVLRPRRPSTEPDRSRLNAALFAFCALNVAVAGRRLLKHQGSRSSR